MTRKSPPSDDLLTPLFYKHRQKKQKNTLERSSSWFSPSHIANAQRIPFRSTSTNSQAEVEPLHRRPDVIASSNGDTFIPEKESSFWCWEERVSLLKNRESFFRDLSGPLCPSHYCDALSLDCRRLTYISIFLQKEAKALFLLLKTLYYLFALFSCNNEMSFLGTLKWGDLIILVFENVTFCKTYYRIPQKTIVYMNKQALSEGVQGEHLT